MSVVSHQRMPRAARAGDIRPVDRMPPALASSLTAPSPSPVVSPRTAPSLVAPSSVPGPARRPHDALLGVVLGPFRLDLTLGARGEEARGCEAPARHGRVLGVGA